MNENITVVGNVATDPKRGTTPSGVEYVSLRVASDARRRDPATGGWVDGEPNWYTINAYRALAENIHASVRVGDRVMVHGRLRIRPWTDGERRGTAIEVLADAFGQDLRWGTTTFRRNARTTPTDPEGDGAGFLPPEDPDGSITTEVSEPEADAVPVPF